MERADEIGGKQGLPLTVTAYQTKSRVWKTKKKRKEQAKVSAEEEGAGGIRCGIRKERPLQVGKSLQSRHKAEHVQSISLQKEEERTH